MNSGYSLSIFWSEDDRGFIALVPEFPGLSAFGETRDEAAREAEIALAGMIASYKEDGEQLPVPKKLPQYSGQFRLRVAPSLHKAAVLEAQRENISLNAFVGTALAVYLGEKKKDDLIFKRLDKLQSSIEAHDRTSQINSIETVLGGIATLRSFNIPLTISSPHHQQLTEKNTIEFAGMVKQ